MTRLSAMSWNRAAAFSCLAVYGPSLLMAIYTLLFVSCSHCKATVWMLLPCAPGLLPVETLRRLLNLPRPDDTIAFLFAFLTCISIVFLLTLLIRRGKWLRLTTIALTVALSTLCAIATLGLIRS
jgi:hypothetical protein